MIWEGGPEGDETSAPKCVLPMDGRGQFEGVNLEQRSYCMDGVSQASAGPGHRALEACWALGFILNIQDITGGLCPWSQSQQKAGKDSKPRLHVPAACISPAAVPGCSAGWLSRCWKCEKFPVLESMAPGACALHLIQQNPFLLGSPAPTAPKVIAMLCEDGHPFLPLLRAHVAPPLLGTAVPPWVAPGSCFGQCSRSDTVPIPGPGLQRPGPQWKEAWLPW